MKFSRLLSTAAVVSMAVASFSTSAGTQTSTMNVLASVVPKCTIAAIGDMDFGTYVQESGAVDTTTQIGVTCPLATAYVISLGGLVGGNRSIANGANNLAYNIFSDAGRTAVWGSTVGVDTVAGTGDGTNINHPVFGRVFDNAANRLIPPGAYTGVVTVTVTY